MLETLLADVRYALRWLRRSPGFTLVAVASLTVGIGFNTAIFTLVDAVLFRPLPVEHPDRLVDVYTMGVAEEPYGTNSYPDYRDLKAQNTVLTDMIAYSDTLDAINLGDRSRLALGEVVTGNYFQVLGVRAVVGRTFTPDDDRPGAPRVTVLSYRVWVRDFAQSPSAMGRTLRIHNQPYTIVGVAPREFGGMLPIISPELWTPMQYVDDGSTTGMQMSVPSPTGNTQLERRGTRFLSVKARLKDGVTVASAEANLKVVMQQLATTYPATNNLQNTPLTAALVPSNKVHIHPVADRMLLPIAAGLMVVVGLMLLIACANVASMLLARASGRRKEIGIRLAIGASRGRLVQQLVTESLVMAAIGAAAGVGLAYALTQLVASIQIPIPIPLALALRIDTRVLSFTTLVAVAAGVIAGLVPALKATRPDIVSELKGEAGGAQAGGRRWTLRDALVATQIAVTMVLLIAAGLLTRSLMSAQNTKLGFRSHGVAIASAGMEMIGYNQERSTQFFEQALARVRSIPIVESAAIVDRTPFALNYSRNLIFLPDRDTPNDKGRSIDVVHASPEYFATLEIPIVRGRNFTTADTPKSPQVAIVNETFARRFWPNEDVIGKHFKRRGLNGPDVEIVGVAADHKVSSVGEDPTPYIHYAYSQAPDAGESIVARTSGDAGTLLAAMQRELLSLEPNIVLIDKQTMDTQVGATLIPARLGAISVAVVGAVAMALAAIGLYGVIAYAVSRRTREIGIRMALGADRSSVLMLIMRQGLAVAFAGMVAGGLLAFAAARAVAGALYGVSPMDPVAWIAATAVLLSVSALANIVPASRAARLDPSTALRMD